MRTHIGQYRIEAPLGRGGMGVVYRGVHEHLGRPVAIKALAPELTQQPEFKERFFSEAKTQARLQHPNIVGVYDLLEENGEYFIVMEFVAGEGLDDRLKTITGRGMEVQEAVGVFSQVLAALDYAHSEGVIHRDIKPSNVMITAGGRVKLTDFGIALLIGDKRLTASQSAIGTPTYMSPEQILRPRSVDHRTDIYSAAVVFYEMLAGKPPFDDDTEYGIKKLHVEAPVPDLGALHPGLPGGVVQAVAVALSKNPDERFASAGLFIRALQEAAPLAIPTGATPAAGPVYRPTTMDSTWTNAGPATAAPPPAAAPPPKPASTGALSALLQGKNRWAVLGGAAVLLLLLSFGAVVFLLSPGKEEGEKVAEATVQPAAPAAGTVAGEAALPVSATPMMAPEPGGVVPAPLSASAGQLQQLPSQEPRVRPTVEPSAVPSEPRKKKETKPEPQAPTPAPSPVVEEPAPQPAAPREEEERPASPASAGIDQFKEMEALVIKIANLSEKAMESQEEAGEGELFNRLEAFSEAAVDTKREFRKATGTGLRGTFSKIRGKSGDTRAMEIKVDDLSRRADEINRLISSGSPTTQDYWKEIRSHLRNLKSLF
jgi:eukaryotic-like serine/threonine-protein kinase